MTTAPQRRLSHLTLLEVLIGVALLAVAGFFLVRNMQQAKVREQTRQLMQAIQHDDTATATRLLEASPFLRDAKDNRGWTPLHWAANYGKEALVELLLARGANINAKNNDGVTPLHNMAAIRRVDMAKLLLAKGADPKTRDKDGDTPLHAAGDKRNSGVMELLLENGADINARNNDGMTPLGVAKQRGDNDTITFLLSHGAKE